MFTIHIYLRFALIFLFLGGGIVLAFMYGFWYSLPVILIGVVLLAGYIFLGTVQSAAQLLEKTQFDEAEKRLNLTFRPNWLYSTNKAYYFLLKGSLALQRKDNEAGEAYLKKAQSIKLPGDNEKAMVQLQLANLSANKGKWNEARIYFRETKNLKVSEPGLRDQLKQFEKALSNRGQMKHMAQGKKGGAMIQQGGKRRRPKMR